MSSVERGGDAVHIAAKVAMETPAPTQRRSDREDITVSTTLRASGNHSLDVVIRNISTLGFMAEGDINFEPESHVRVRLPTLGTVVARVVWAKEGQFGAEFVQEIDLQRLRAVLAATGAAPPRRDRRPRLLS